MSNEVDVFVPCCVDQFYPQIAWDMIALIESLGYKAFYKENQTCCGRLLYDNGNWNIAKNLGEKFITDFKGTRTIVGCSTSCIGYIKNNYPKIFHNTSYHNPAKNLADRIMDISEFIHVVRPSCDIKAHFPFKVFLHNNCHSLNEYNVEQEVRFILSKVEGLQMVNPQGRDFCCGFGGNLSIYNKVVSQELARAKVEYALQCGAQYVTSTDATCLMHLDNYIRNNKLDLKTIHLVSLLRYEQ